MSELEKLHQVIHNIFPEPPLSIREIKLLIALKRIVEGEPLESVCSELSLQPRHTTKIVDRVRAQGLQGFLQYQHPITEEALSRRRRGISQMLLGALAEKRFEELSQEITGGRVLKIEDHRPSRTDTDYRLLNGHENPLCRLNIKFHGTLFRESLRHVGLEPEDCFALATYKINNALKRQEADRLPYVFLILSIPHLSSGEVAQLIPYDFVWTLCVFNGKRIVEEAIVDRLRSESYRHQFRGILDRMEEGQFRIISAKKADKLLREKMFERVPALSLKGFTSRFRNAEVDMHFSLSRELTPIRTFLQLLTTESTQRFAVILYNGDY